MTGGGIGLLISYALVTFVQNIPNKEDAMEFLGNPNISTPIALVTVGILAVIGLSAPIAP